MSERESIHTKRIAFALDLITAVLYIGKIEGNFHGSKNFDPFERLLNDELDVDRPLVLCNVYETITGQDYEVLNHSKVLKTFPK